MNELKTLLKDLHILSNLSLSIFDIHEKLVASYPDGKIPFCAMIEQNPNTMLHCKRCDHKAFEIVKKTNKMYLYQCHFHLYEAVVPLYTYGSLSGYLMIGQCFEEKQNMQDQLYQEINHHFKNKEQLKQAINQIPIHSIEKIYALQRVLQTYGKYITLSNQLQIKKQDLALYVKQYLTLNYQRELNIDLLCEHFVCSKTTLTSHFKKAYGMTIHQFLLDYRLNQALELLKHSSLTILEISNQCGFNDPNYFSKAFKHKYKIAPNVYRKKISIK